MSSMSRVGPHERMNPKHQLIENPLDALAREINDAHREVQRHAKGMLLEAKRAGDALTVAKDHFGKNDRAFGQWRKANLTPSQQHCWRYMEVSRRWLPHSRGSGVDVADVSIRAFLEIRDKPKPASDSPQFDANDADHARKLHAMATRGTEHEAAIAQTKLDSFAKQFGMTADEVMAKADQVSPEITWQEEQVNKYMTRKFGKKTKDELMEVILFCIAKHPDLIRDFKTMN